MDPGLRSYGGCHCKVITNKNSRTICFKENYIFGILVSSLLEGGIKMYKENLKKNQEQIHQGLALKYALSQSSLFSYSEE